MKTILLTAGLTAGLIAGTMLSLPVLAQVGQDQPQPPAGAASDQAPPNQSLSKTLSQSKGVIQPPPTGDKGVVTPPQTADAPAIPPPGTPGGDQTVQPK
jgi:hypothetical protein